MHITARENLHMYIFARSAGHKEKQKNSDTSVVKDYDETLPFHVAAAATPEEPPTPVVSPQLSTDEKRNKYQTKPEPKQEHSEKSEATDHALKQDPAKKEKPDKSTKKSDDNGEEDAFTESDKEARVVWLCSLLRSC